MDSMTQLLRILHRPYHEQLHVGTIFFELHYTCQPIHQKREEAPACDSAGCKH